jgi:hypothetical protein
MEGASPTRKGRFRVHREFERSRIELAMLATAYRRIVPEDRLSLAERNGDPTDRRSADSQSDLQEHIDWIQHHVSAIGGH